MERTIRTRLAFVAVAAALVASVASAQTRVAAIGTRLTANQQHIVPGNAVAGAIVINLPQLMLFYRNDETSIEAPIAGGRRTWQTPTGAFTIVEKRVDPVWHVPPSIMRESERLGHELPPAVPPGPNNPLGKYWLGTSLTGIGIHGTNAPSSISRAVTHGCIRVGTDDIRALFESATIDTPGNLIYEPILLATVGGEIYLEVNVDVYRRVGTRPLDVVKDLAAQAGVTSRVDWGVAAAVVAAHEGIAKVITARTR
jgi:L,D-transpeptidase ErfK/SrfK